MLRNDTHFAQGVFMWNLLFEAAGNNSEFAVTFFLSSYTYFMLSYQVMLHFLIFNVYLQHRLQLTANQRYCFPLCLIYSWWSLCHNSKLLFPIQAFFPSWLPLTWWIWFIKDSRFFMEIAFQLTHNGKQLRIEVHDKRKRETTQRMASSIPLTAIPYHHQKI